MRFERSKLFDHLTVVMVGHDLVSLYYPFVESFWSALQLGCRFILGNFGSSDETRTWLERLGEFAPVEVVDGTWRRETGGTAIGLATKDLLLRSGTEWVYNLQACEVLEDGFVDSVVRNFEAEIGPKPAYKMCAGMPLFRHFWGDLNFDACSPGSPGGAYGSAQRLLHVSDRIEIGDGCNPEPHGGYGLGWVYRYSYCFKNQIHVKFPHHVGLYGHDGAAVQNGYSSMEWCRSHSNYSGAHPSFVQHLVGQSDYDLGRSFGMFEGAVERVR